MYRLCLVRSTQALLCILASTLIGCTITPPLNTEGAPTYDYAASQYPASSSGILEIIYVKGRVYSLRPFDGAVKFLLVTPKRAANNNAAIPFVDCFGNHLFILPPDSFASKYNGIIDAQKTKLENAK